MQRFHTAVMAVALLAGTSLAFAQQEKSQQNAADEALTRSAPEAKDQPQAPAAARQNEASQPGLKENTNVLTEGKLTSSDKPNPEAEPAKYSLKNDKIDNLPTMAFPLMLTDRQKRAIYEHMSGGLAPAPVSNITAKPSEQVPATLPLQELPPEMLASMPSVRDYKFLRTNDRILVVNPRESIVVGEITN